MWSLLVFSGNEYQSIVEFAPYQKIPKNQTKIAKKDSKSGTLETDPDYVAFLDALQNPDLSSLLNPETYLEELETKEKEAKSKWSQTIFFNRQMECYGGQTKNSRKLIS